MPTLTYKLPLYPTKEQQELLWEWSRSLNNLYNHFIELQKDRLKKNQPLLGRYDMQNLIPTLKNEMENLNNVYAAAEDAKKRSEEVPVNPEVPEDLQELSKKRLQWLFLSQYHTNRARFFLARAQVMYLYHHAHHLALKRGESRPQKRLRLQVLKIAFRDSMVDAGLLRWIEEQ